MIVRHLASATQIIEANNIKILTDPWLVDGTFYGSWYHFPPIDLNTIALDNIDFVFVSHIHPDHADDKTLDLINKNVKFLIHRFEKPYLKFFLERAGFEVIELAHGCPFELGNGVKITIYGADNCDPTLCGKMFGCIPDAPKGSLQIDSVCLIDDGESIYVNTNDAPFEITKNVLKDIKENYPVIDIAAIGYASASPYPHCMIDYDEKSFIEGRNRAINRGLNSAISTLKMLSPKAFIPFAGTFILGGKLSSLYDKMPIIELQDACQKICQDQYLKSIGSKPVMLNFNAFYDTKNCIQSDEYIPIDPVLRKDYALNHISKFKYDYEADEIPDAGDIFSLAQKAFLRFNKKLDEIELYSKMAFFIDFGGHHLLRLNYNRDPLEMCKDIKDKEYIYYKIDARLLYRVLKGPKFANWNNMEVGSHILMRRYPDVYNPEYYYPLNSFHE